MLINCSLFFYSCSRVPTVPDPESDGPQIFSNFPSFSNLFQPFVNFLPRLSFQYAASSKLFPRKQLRRSSKVFTLPLDYTHREYNNLQLLDYTQRVSVVSITAYDCLHPQELQCTENYRKYFEELKSGQKHSKVSRSTRLWTLPPAWGSLAKAANFRPSTWEILGEKFKTAYTSFITT